MDRYQSNLVWIDLEMTGLNPEIDTILEIATIITDNSLNTIIPGPSFVIHQDEAQLSVMDEWNQNQHGKSGLIERVRASTVTLEQAQSETLAFIEQHCKKNSAPACGNSIWQDRIFLRKYMPLLDSYLHYRIIDVSSIKESVKRWYPNNASTNFIKVENHRAYEDILQSVEELKHYKTYFFCEKK